MTDKAKCYSCKHRGTVPGSCHSSCKHPSIKSTDDPIAGMMAIFASVGRVAPVIGPEAKELNVTGHPHGIQNGWFNWPFNFDPVWLESCNGFEREK